MDSRFESQPYQWQVSTEATPIVTASYLLCDHNIYPLACWEEQIRNI